MRRTTHYRLLRLAAAALGILAPSLPAAAQDGAMPTSTAVRKRPTTAPATTQAAPGDDVAEAQAARKEREEQLTGMPALHVKSLREVVQFAIENDDVILRTSLPPAETSSLFVDGKPTLISVAAQRGDGNEPTYQPPVFILIRHEYAAPGSIAITHINAIAPRVAISKSADGGGVFRNVDFIQSDEFLEEGDERVRLYVQEHRNDEPFVNLTLSAANITELRRKYPAETMRYLEPIFRDFGQAAVLFQVNARAAWQVLGGTYAPPADIAKQVDALLVRLDADDAKVREAALKELEQLGQEAALVLMKRDRAGLSEEQQSRVETFLAPYKPLTDEEAARMRDDAEFLLTALSAEEPELTTRALERLQEIAKQPIAFDASATGNARADAIARLRAELIPAATQPATTQTRRSTPAEPAP